MAESRFIVGIDLGTTNSALAYVDLNEKAENPKVNILEIPQVVRPGAVEPRPLLPSFLYLPAENELPAGSLELPWDEKRTCAVGEYARSRGKEVPGRLASSAKSWLCQAGVDRRSALLPFGATEDVKKLSPVEVSTRILQHLGEAWDHSAGKGQKGGKLKQQQVLLCVPASFDAAARDLTMEAAKAAGFDDVSLLEEPQAAFYSWLESTHNKWRKQVEVGDLVLVVDVGGGTTDFSLIAAAEEKGALTLHRIAVGEHILLGGDNMDLALAHAVAARLAEDGTKLDSWQLRALAHGCREAKEKLLSDSPAAKKDGTKDEYPLAILGRGSSVVGRSIKTKITRDQVTEAILDGFFGLCKPTDRPVRTMRTGLQELGLSYAADPSISKHLARFLAKENLSTERELPVTLKGNVFVHPTAILFNGGVMKASALCSRIVQLLNGWLKDEGSEPARVLPGVDLDLAVARGAVFYGLSTRGKGVRIRGGVARSYYIGVEASMPTVPGHKPPTKALCVVPFGMEEGTEAEVPGAEFGLVVGEPAQFRFLSSTTRRDDRVGSILEDWEDTVAELAPIEANLPPTKKAAAGTLVPVRLRCKVTAVGTLELWCHERDGAGKWKLELNVRE
ncbi:MAG: Hsp70 family protein [Planctomycetota bacterium]|nr:Hsp70 family protein [Planctomycetota bacterium]